MDGEHCKPLSRRRAERQPGYLKQREPIIEVRARGGPCRKTIQQALRSDDDALPARSCQVQNFRVAPWRSDMDRPELPLRVDLTRSPNLPATTAVCALRPKTTAERGWLLARRVAAGRRTRLTWRALLASDVHFGRPIRSLFAYNKRTVCLLLEPMSFDRRTPIYRFRREIRFAKPPAAIWPFVSDSARLWELPVWRPTGSRNGWTRRAGSTALSAARSGLFRRVGRRNLANGRKITALSRSETIRTARCGAGNGIASSLLKAKAAG